MTASISSDVTSGSVQNAPTSVVPAAMPANAVVARVDIAHVANKQFLAYGWILGYTKLVHSASIYLGSMVIDLVKQGVPVRRPDVAQHFSLEGVDDTHGFYVLVDLLGKNASVDHLTLSVTLSSGETTEGRWSVSGDSLLDDSVAEPYVTTLNALAPQLSGQEAKRLIAFTTALGLHMGAEYSTLPPPVRFTLDLCCVLENRILVVCGWIFDPVHELTLVQLRVGGSMFDVLKNSLWIARPEINPDPALYRKRDTPRRSGFVVVQPVAEPDTQTDEARFTIAAGSETAHLTRPLSQIPQEARRDFLSLLSKMDPNPGLALIECVTAVLDNSPEQQSLDALLELVRHTTIERLPASILSTTPRYTLQIDQAIPVADKGIFLMGWFNAEAADSPQVVCHCDSSSFVVSDNWTRHARADVTSHLANSGIQTADNQHGFVCYVPLSNGPAPYYLSAVSESGTIERMRVTSSVAAESASQTVRALLTSFSCEHFDMRSLMESQLGPAVTDAWAARQKPLRKSVIRNYGPKQAQPSTSIIVPLYGRHEFAEYQMALFADDPEFQGIELIYVVDDPAIFTEFSSVCADLYGMYQVPFVLAFSGSNLGFAGANNFGAEVARGQYLLFLNSDVLPKRPLWVGDLLRIYRSLSSPGLVGVKLIYEDGSVQHAGIAFRRYPAWGDMWINDHPFKGQSPLGLSGVLEVDAVTAACVVVEASLYRELGGFSEDYIIGDFEDSDLCLRALSAGRRSYVALDVELYHLERQSQNRTGDVTWRTNLTAYNCWLHHRRWAGLIESRCEPTVSGKPA
jgi:hypothetical protein